MDFNQVVERLLSKPKYMTNGAGHLSKLFNCSKEDVYKAKKVIYGKIKLVEEPIKQMPVVPVPCTYSVSFISKYSLNSQLGTSRTSL